MASLTDLRTTRLLPARRSNAGRLLLALTVLAVVLIVAEASACPTCKDAVNTSDVDGLNVARGYFYSILLMLAMPFTLGGSFGCYVWREMRRQQRSLVEQPDLVGRPALDGQPAAGGSPQP